MQKKQEEKANFNKNSNVYQNMHTNNDTWQSLIILKYDIWVFKLK